MNRAESKTFNNARKLKSKKLLGNPLTFPSLNFIYKYFSSPIALKGDVDQINRFYSHFFAKSRIILVLLLFEEMMGDHNSKGGLKNLNS